MRLAAAEEAADPCGFLVGLAQTVEVRADDPLHAVGVLALAHERREFAAQLFECLCVMTVDDPRLPLVDQGEGIRISLQNVLDLHCTPPSPCRVMGTAM